LYEFVVLSFFYAKACRRCTDPKATALQPGSAAACFRAPLRVLWPFSPSVCSFRPTPRGFFSTKVLSRSCFPFCLIPDSGFCLCRSSQLCADFVWRREICAFSVLRLFDSYCYPIPFGRSTQFSRGRAKSAYSRKFPTFLSTI
jgi:hypothetical protein